MQELINEQISKVIEEIELIPNVYERSSIRVQLVNALSNLTTSVKTTTKTTKGKKAIKSDVVKETPVVEEAIPEVVDNNAEPIVLEEVDEAGGTPIALEQHAVIVKSEQEDGSFIDLDVTEAYMLTADYVAEGDEDVEATRRDIAKTLTEYSLMPVYTTLESVPTSYNKMMLSYYMVGYGIEAINEFVSNLTDGNIADVYQFVNIDTIAPLVADLERAAAQQ